MTGRRIVVVSPRTWGQFGNFLAATRLAGVLRDRFEDGDVAVWEAESTMPWVGEIGGRIADITLTSPDTATRTARYLDLMAEVEREHPAGFEVDEGSTVRAKVTGLAEALAQAKPDLIVGTKGFVARLCRVARDVAGLPAPVVSYVTNPGLLDLPIHRSASLDAVLVPFGWAKEKLVATVPVDPGSVHVVGPLVAQRELGSFAKSSSGSSEDAGWPEFDDGSPRPRVIVFSNRGGDDYTRVLRHLAEHHPEADVVFVGYNDPGAVEKATSGTVPTRWRFHTRLSQQEYFAYMEGAAAAETALLISKAGPNTTLESAYFGIPVLMLRSGLPMEHWVGSLIADRELGRCCTDVEQLIAVLDAWLSDPARLHVHRDACRAFSRTTLDQTATAAAIAQALTEVLDRRAAEVTEQEETTGA